MRRRLAETEAQGDVALAVAKPFSRRDDVALAEAKAKADQAPDTRTPAQYFRERQAETITPHGRILIDSVEEEDGKSTTRLRMAGSGVSAIRSAPMARIVTTWSRR